PGSMLPGWIGMQRRSCSDQRKPLGHLPPSGGSLSSSSLLVTTIVVPPSSNSSASVTATIFTLRLLSAMNLSARSLELGDGGLGPLRRLDPRVAHEPAASLFSVVTHGSQVCRARSRDIPFLKIASARSCPRFMATTLPQLARPLAITTGAVSTMM